MSYDCGVVMAGTKNLKILSIYNSIVDEAHLRKNIDPIDLISLAGKHCLTNIRSKFKNLRIFLGFSVSKNRIIKHSRGHALCRRENRFQKIVRNMYQVFLVLFDERNFFRLQPRRVDLVPLQVSE